MKKEETEQREKAVKDRMGAELVQREDKAIDDVEHKETVQ